MTLPGQLSWQKLHLPLCIVTNINHAPMNAHGWTYILLSGDKKKMKIGQTVLSVQDRTYALESDRIYGHLNLHFLLAIKGKNYEGILHRYFENYRAIYRRPDKNGKMIYCNWQEYKKLRSSEQAVTFQRVPTVELFHIPPRKIGKRLTEIVTTLLSGQ